MPRLSDVVNAERVTAAFREAGLRAARARPLTLIRAWPDGRGRLVALFGGPGEALSTQWWSLLPLPRGGPSASMRHALRTGRGAILPTLGAFAQAFPEDIRLPRLGRALEAEAARRRFSRRRPEEFPRPDHVEPRPTGYRPMRRCAVRYRLGRTSGESAYLFGKCYRAGEDAVVLALHESLHEGRAVGRLAGWRIARPSLRIPEWSMLVWRPEPGESLHSALGRPGAEARARSSGAALAGLHGSRADWTRSHTLEDEIRTVNLWAAAAKGAFPDAAPRLGRAEAAWMRLAARLPPGPFVPSHRDYHDKQILVDEGGATLLDLDLACRAAPELDLGNLLAHFLLRRLQGRLAETRGLGEALIEGYAGGGGRPDPARLRFYESGTLLRLACVYAFRPRWDLLSDLLLEEALERFDARPDSGGDCHAHTVDSVPAADGPGDARAAGRRG